jgi:hypothetical protein
MTEEPLVEVVGLKEALKIRCISKGPPLTYFVLKPLQKSLWKHLNTMWNFELTGTPITEDLINRRFAQFIGTHRFHSGDYSAATDEIQSWCSNSASDTIFEVAEKNLGYPLSGFDTLFKRALTGHRYVRYDRKGLKFLDKRKEGEKKEKIKEKSRLDRRLEKSRRSRRYAIKRPGN